MLRSILLSTTSICRAPDGGAGGDAAPAAPTAPAAPAPPAASDAAPAAAAAPAAPAAPTTGDWTSTLTEDQRSYVSTKGYKTPGDLLTAYHNAERAIGLDKVAIPKEDSPQEVKDAFFEKIGRPKDPAGYELAAPKDMPQYDRAVSDAFAKKAFELGIPKSAAVGLHDWFMGLAAQSFTGQDAALAALHEQNQSTLKEKWGVAYPAKWEAANSAIRQWGGEELATELKRLNLHSNPILNEAFAKIGAASAGDKIGDTNGATNFTMTPAEAQAEIKRMEADAGGPLFNKSHPEHAEAVKRRATLFEMAYPEPKN